VLCLVFWFLTEPNCILVCWPSLESWWLASKSTTLRLGVKQRGRLFAGDVEAPFFVEKLLSGKRDQGDHGDLVTSLCDELKYHRKIFDYRKTILSVSASTTGSKSGFVPYRTTG